MRELRVKLQVVYISMHKFVFGHIQQIEHQTGMVVDSISHVPVRA